MRRSILRLTLALGLAAAGSAHAQLSKPRRDPFAKVYSSPVVPAPPRKAAPLTSLAPPPRLALTGLTAVGDAAPACRAQCSVVRYSCDAAGDDVCGAHWARCLSTCSVSPPSRAR